jgi:hypothetical protein
VNAAALAVFLLLMLGAFFGLAWVDRRALPPALGTAALLIVAAAYVAFLFAS